MGWLPSIFGSGKSTDPVDKLDPKLREFLDRESPVKYTPAQPSPPPAATPTPHALDDVKVAAPEAEKPLVPAASLYQDGRYAHLWKNYQPLAQIEAENTSDHDKLMNVLESYKGRKAAIGQAALENCAEQQEEWVNCMKRGSWEDQLQMCRHQVRRFEKCYSMQSKFLRALGYGSVIGRSPTVEEDIQMHADSLFQRMIRHEEAVEQAKKDGTPIPVFEVSIPRPKTTAAAAAAEPTEDVKKEWQKRLEELPEEERVVEAAALRGDLEAKAEVTRKARQLWDAQQEDKARRKAAGQTTVSENVIDGLTDLWKGIWK
ncbi:hypothetical protein HIM_03053 [Hirsutella minnesotensis 3608]|nr:hypothetical protein HIM_03053 [Hirsutella minnesotensis 3608]